MKKLMLLACLLATPLLTAPAETAPVQAQTPKAPLEGLGKYKIGMPLEAFLAAHPLLGKVHPRQDHDQLKPGAYEMPGVVESQDDQTSAIGNFDQLARAFLIKGYVISGITIDLELLFYKGKLAQAVTESRELQDAFVAKYGYGEVTTQTDKTSCTDPKTGLVKPLETLATTRNWAYWDNHASTYQTVWYDERCEKHYLTYTSVLNSPAFIEYYKRNEALKQSRESASKPAASSPPTVLDEL